MEQGKEALSFSSGAAAILTVAQSLVTVGDNAVVSCSVHGGTFHQFQVILPAMGLKCRIIDTNDLEKVESLVDERTKFVFTETISNPKFAVGDLEGLATITRRANIPLIVDATFSAAGFFCQPARFGVDIIIHSATKWIGGHGTTLGGVVIETGRSAWQSNAACFPHLHAKRGRNGTDASLYDQFGDGAYMTFLRWDFMRDTGACLGAQAAQQLFIGVETLSLRCERQHQNAQIMGIWLRNHPRVAWVNYLGFQDHPYHKLAQRYLQNGFGTVMTFGLKGCVAMAWEVIDALELISNTPNVGDAKTTVGHHWSTTHKGCSLKENEAMGVYEDLFRLSLGIEKVEDLIADFDQAFDAVPLESSNY
jgi:O-acetylhomoserine/O-acetylserine sulfhydrylase